MSQMPSLTNLAVVAYPRIVASAQQRIEAMRAPHDPQARLIAAHFTLVFPAVVEHRLVSTHVAVVEVVEIAVDGVRSRAIHTLGASEQGGPP